MFLFGDSVTVDVTEPFTLTVDGESAHVELAGSPVQVRATEPVRPLIGAKVTVYVAWCPEEMVSAAGVTLMEKSSTVWLKLADVLLMKLPSLFV
jgi:hypothetical protein